MTTSSDSNLCNAMTLELFEALLKYTALESYASFLESFLTVKYEIDIDACVDTKGIAQHGASVKLLPAFWDCNIDETKWVETARDMAAFVCSAHLEQGRPVFRECSVDIVQTVFCEAGTM